jgi:hypothetical protein
MLLFVIFPVLVKKEVERADPDGRIGPDSTIEVMYIAVHRSKDALFALSFFLVMALVVFSTLIYFVERGVWDSTLGTFVTADGEYEGGRVRERERRS